MAKKGGDPKADLGFGKKGKQDIKEGRGYDAMPAFKKTATPASVKGEGYTSGGSKYKHASN